MENDIEIEVEPEELPGEDATETVEIEQIEAETVEENPVDLTVVVNNEGEGEEWNEEAEQLADDQTAQAVAEATTDAILEAQILTLQQQISQLQEQVSSLVALPLTSETAPEPMLEATEPLDENETIVEDLQVSRKRERKSRTVLDWLT